MIHHIKGNITFKAPTHIIVEANGIGYFIHISLYTYSRIEKLESIKILTHLQIKEDAHTLYGFSDEAERNIFLHLITVSGIGTNTARVLLSAMAPEEARAAIIGEDLVAFRKIKGIGDKTAKRIILDLKDKMLKDGGEITTTSSSTGSILREEALQALVALGFPKIQVQKTLNKVISEQPSIVSIEDLIKIALKNMA